MRPARTRKLITGRGKSDDGFAPNFDMRNVAGRYEREIAGTNPAACSKKYIAGVKIESGFADMARRGRRAERYAVVVGLRIFLQQDRVRAVRHNAAGKDAHRLAFAHSRDEGMAGRRRSDDSQCHRFAMRIGKPHGITIHCRNWSRGLIAPRNDIARENAAMPLFERDDFALERHDRRSDALHCLVDGNHPGAAA
jgi:hypothetical protein